MNKPKFIATLALLIGTLLFLPIFAAAAPGITDSEVVVEVDYNKFSDDNDKIISVVTKMFIITNDGLQDITVTVEAIGLPSGYKSGSIVKVIPANTSNYPVTLTIDVPHKKGPGKEKIGTIVIKDGENQLDSADLVQDTASMLDLEELEVKYTDYKGKVQKEEFKDHEEDTYALSDEVRPYTEVTLTFNLQNLFDSNYKDDGALDELELSIDADDEDLFEDPLEDKYEIDSIVAGKDGEYAISFMINKEVEVDKYALDLTLSAEDGQGVEYRVEKRLVLEVEINDDDVRVVKAEVMPEVTACSVEFNFDVEVYNFGTDLQKLVGLSIVNEELGIDENVKEIELKSYLKDPNYWKKIFTFELAKKPKVKTYFLDVTAYINGDQPADQERIEVNVKPCLEEPVEETAEQQAEVTGGVNSASQETSTETTAVVKTVEGPSYTTNDYVMALLVIAIVAVAVMIVLLLVALFRR